MTNSTHSSPFVGPSQKVIHPLPVWAQPALEQNHVRVETLFNQQQDVHMHSQTVAGISAQPAYCSERNDQVTLSDSGNRLCNVLARNAEHAYKLLGEKIRSDTLLEEIVTLKGQLVEQERLVQALRAEKTAAESARDNAFQMCTYKDDTELLLNYLFTGGGAAHYPGNARDMIAGLLWEKDQLAGSYTQLSQNMHHMATAHGIELAEVKKTAENVTSKLDQENRDLDSQANALQELVSERDRDCEQLQSQVQRLNDDLQQSVGRVKVLEEALTVAQRSNRREGRRASSMRVTSQAASRRALREASCVSTEPSTTEMKDGVEVASAMTL